MKEHKDSWFGARTDNEASWLIKQLEIAYRGSHPDPLCVQDFNGMTVAQALRLRMLHPSLIAGEFEDMLRKNPTGEIQHVEKSILEIETEKIKNMNDEERKEFSRKLLFKEGYHLYNNGIHKKFRIGCDKSVFGFAIDSVTLKHKKSNSFGEHYIVEQKLFDELSISYRVADYPIVKSKIIAGLIFTEIDDFDSPILRLRLMFKDEAAIDIVVRFLKKQKKYIIIDDDYKVL